MVKHNLIFCFILIICSLTTNCLKRKVDQKTFCAGDEYKFQIKAGQGNALVVSEGFWKNKLLPSLHGLPVDDEDDEEFEQELEKFEDDNLLLRGGETELYDSKGKKFQLKDLDVWDDDVEDIKLNLDDFDDSSNLVLDDKVELYKPVPLKADIGKVNEKVELTDTRGSDFEDSEEETIEKEFLDNDQ
jgi:hypothetical protein